MVKEYECVFLFHDSIHPSEAIAVDRIECVDCNGECPKKKIRGKITPRCWRIGKGAKKK